MCFTIWRSNQNYIEYLKGFSHNGHLSPIHRISARSQSILRLYIHFAKGLKVPYASYCGSRPLLAPRWSFTIISVIACFSRSRAALSAFTGALATAMASEEEALKDRAAWRRCWERTGTDAWSRGQPHIDYEDWDFLLPPPCPVLFYLLLCAIKKKSVLLNKKIKNSCMVNAVIKPKTNQTKTRARIAVFISSPKN